MSKFLLIMLIIVVLGLAGCGAQVSKIKSAQTSGKMTPEKLTELLLNIDKAAEINANSIAFKIRERELILVYDKAADRMRVVSPVAQSGLADIDIMARMMQANYDAVLDSRYAMANNLIWSVFIHPLGSLTEDDFLSGIAQVYTGAETFGTTYTSGAIVFGGGDSNAIHEDLLKALERANDTEGQGI